MIVSIMFSGCALFQPIDKNNNKDNTTVNGEEWLSLKCFQTLSNAPEYSQCLAWNSNYDVHYIVNFTCPTSKKNVVFYDDKSLTGKFVFVGTYTYESKDGQKTVRAYMFKDNYNEWFVYDKETLIQLLDIVLSYNAVKQ